ncbi:MAG: hypothetical protein CMJ83_05475 [Planctomycetes bacterium]|nr:hypothetical protein [Planctomycetota bacterium]
MRNRAILIPGAWAVLAAVLSAQDVPTVRPSHVTFEYAIIWGAEPKRAPLPVLATVAKKKHPEMRIVARLEAAPDDLVLRAQMVPAYSAPDADRLARWGRGLTTKQKKILPKSPTALVMTFRCPLREARSGLQIAATLVEYMARRSKGAIWDTTTGEVFGSATWRRTRLTGWLEDVPYISKEIAVDVQASDGIWRAVSRGMSKFGQPDVAVGAFARIHEGVAKRLVILACQSLAESSAKWPTSSIKLDIDRIEHFEVRKEILEALGKNASRKAIVQVQPAQRCPGDPPNGLIELMFAGAPSVPLHQRQESLFLHVFGEPKETRGKPTPREAEKLASRAARSRLFREIKPKFRNGVPPGETLLVKAPFKNRKGLKEYLWVEVASWDISRVKGRLMNTPRDIPGMREGQEVEVKDAEIFDYKWYRADGRIEGNETEKARDNKKK